MIRILAKKSKRVVVRCQPYIPDIFEDVKSNVKRFADAGTHGVIFEGMKFVKSKPGLVKVAGDNVFPYKRLKHDFERLKQECNKHGLKFYSGENRLRWMGDSLTCCGCAGLDGFKANTFNLSHIVNGDIAEPSQAMKERDSGACFHSIYQTEGLFRFIKGKSFVEMMLWTGQTKRKFVEDVLGVTDRKR